MSETPDYEELWLSMWKDRDEARAEVAELQHEVEELRDILRAAQWLLDPEHHEHRRLLDAVQRTMPTR